MLLNPDSREVQFKIVYCGTPLGGKTSNLEYIHQNLSGPQRGDLVSIATGQNRTLFFDFLPVVATEIEGFQTKFQLYTVPGQRVYGETREVVLKGVDGIVFVADSDPARREANIESHEAMIDALKANGRDLKDIPLVYQYNKRDLPNAMPLEEMDEDFNSTCPSMPTSAKNGYRLFATLDLVSQIVLKNFHLRETGAQSSATNSIPTERKLGSEKEAALSS